MTQRTDILSAVAIGVKARLASSGRDKGSHLRSANGQKVTSARQCGMSVLPRGADMPVTGRVAPEAARSQLFEGDECTVVMRCLGATQAAT